MSGHLTEILQNLMRNNKKHTNDYGKSGNEPGDEDVPWYDDPDIQSIADNTEVKIVLEIPGDDCEGNTEINEVSSGKEALSSGAISLIHLEYAPEWSENGPAKIFYKSTSHPDDLRPSPSRRDKGLPVISLSVQQGTRQAGEQGTGYVYQSRRYSDFTAHSVAAVRQLTRVLIGKAASFF
ncbi:MAG TPA: hypothetical protein VFL76_10560 [Edaphocola sp.]|nr:hypothetical protein [Edaphocola sp.]